jgi:hypothetical protein
MLVHGFKLKLLASPVRDGGAAEQAPHPGIHTLNLRRRARGVNHLVSACRQHKRNFDAERRAA